MKVLLVTQFPPPGGGARGGVQAAAQALVAGLEALNAMTLRVLVLRRDLDRRQDVMSGGVSVAYEPHRERWPAYTAYSQARAIVARECRAFAPDVVHGQGLDAEGYAVAALGDVVRIVTPHGNLLRDESHNSSGWRSRLRGWVRHRLALRAARRATAAIAVGDPADNGAAACRRVYEIPNALRPELLAQPTSGETVPGRILVPAAIRPIKGTNTVVRGVAASASRARWSVALAGPVEDAPYLERVLAESRDLDVPVDYLGQLDARAMAGAIDAAEVVTLGSRWEVAPIAVQEGMARGRTVLAPDLPGVRKLTRGGRAAFLYPPGDERAFGRSLAAIAGEPAEAGRRRALAREIALSSFTSDAVARRTLAVYDELARSAR